MFCVMLYISANPKCLPRNKMFLLAANPMRAVPIKNLYTIKNHLNVIIIIFLQTQSIIKLRWPTIAQNTSRFALISWVYGYGWYRWWFDVVRVSLYVSNDSRFVELIFGERNFRVMGCVQLAEARRPIGYVVGFFFVLSTKRHLTHYGAPFIELNFQDTILYYVKHIYM